MDKDDAPSPGMPEIKNLALFPNFGTVGVTPPSCTIIGDHIKAAGASARPRCRPFSTHYHWQRKNSWRHDHARQSYRFKTAGTVCPIKSQLLIQFIRFAAS